MRRSASGRDRPARAGDGSPWLDEPLRLGRQSGQQDDKKGDSRLRESPLKRTDVAVLLDKLVDEVFQQFLATGGDGWLRRGEDVRADFFERDGLFLDLGTDAFVP